VNLERSPCRGELHPGFASGHDGQCPRLAAAEHL
jgi:hypothetical protein